MHVITPPIKKTPALFPPQSQYHMAAAFCVCPPVKGPANAVLALRSRGVQGRRSKLNPPPPNEDPPWTRGGTTFLCPRRLTSIRALVNIFLPPSSSLKKGGGHIFVPCFFWGIWGRTSIRAYGTNKEGGPLLRGGLLPPCDGSGMGRHASGLGGDVVHVLQEPGVGSIPRGLWGGR